MDLNVYVRCIPSFDEQKVAGSWRREHTTGAGPGQKIQSLIPVWRRCKLPTLPVVISVPGLLKERRQRIDISDDLKLTPEQLAASDIYSARVAINVTETECETATAFDVAVRRAQECILCLILEGHY